MSYEPLEAPRTDPLITVEAAPTDDSAAAEWTEPVVTRPEHHQCQHRLYFHDLNAKGRLAFAGGRAAIWSSWPVIVFGAIFGLGGLIGGVANDNTMLAVGGLLMVCSAVLQVVGAVGLALTWKRPHRPNDVVIGFAAIGYLLFLIVVGMILAATKLVGFAFALVPFAFVLWQLISFRVNLYWSGTCRTYPGFPPAIRALLKRDPGPFAVIPAPARFRVADCPHRLEFRKLRGRFQVATLMNTVLLYGYLVAMLVMVSSRRVVDGGEGDAIGVLVMLLLVLSNLFGVQEIKVRSKRYHRASTSLYIGAFFGYAMTVVIGIWLGGPASFIAMALAAYWAFAAAYVMKVLPPRSECASLREPPPAVQKMLRPVK